MSTNGKYKPPVSFKCFPVSAGQTYIGLDSGLLLNQSEEKSLIDCCPVLFLIRVAQYFLAGVHVCVCVWRGFRVSFDHFGIWDHFG